MNPEEESVKKLFQQFRSEDERNAPPFTHDWNAALSRIDRPRRRWVVWQILPHNPADILMEFLQ